MYTHATPHMHCLCTLAGMSDPQQGRPEPFPRPNRTDASGERVQFPSKHDFLCKIAEMSPSSKVRHCARVSHVSTSQPVEVNPSADFFSTTRIPSLRASAMPNLDEQLPSWK